MKPIQELLDSFQDAEAEARRKQLEVQAELEKGQKDIAAGEDTTGDPITDGIIVLYGKDLLLPDQQIEENFRKVVEMLKGQAGQPVILIHRWIDHEGCSGFGGSLRPVARRSVRLGVISGEELVFDYEKGTCTIPTSSQVSNISEQLQLPNDDGSGLIVANHLRGLFNSPDLGYDLNRELRDEANPSHFLGEGMGAMTLAIGQEGIDEWLAAAERDFRVGNDYTEVVRLCEKLGIDPIQPSKEELKAFLDTFVK